MGIARTSPPTSRLPDADMQAAPVALARAARRAQELAARTGTSLIISEDGRVIERTVTLADLEADGYRERASGGLCGSSPHCNLRNFRLFDRHWAKAWRSKRP